MEQIISFGEDGNIKLPVGYSFDPADDHLVNYYLKRKVFDQPFPVEIIHEFDVFQSEPWGLPGGGKAFNDHKFFFYYTKGNVNGNKDKRAAGSGLWRAVGKAKYIVLSGSKELIGKRNTLIFWEGKGNKPIKTKWAMHEFRLESLANPYQVSNWAVYHIFEKKDAEKAKKGNGDNGEPSNNAEVEKPSVMDFTEESGSDFVPPSSPLSP
ncbi:NAC domain-containing protein 83-like [Gastrolobium bilobum]|uniref:NAC domain-containing protein 83-like n=1 Tax=Gastrolobium bilobum TaxID=150636 RepID=UPI002AB1A42A|nr:NAC domain-containing protein 83-like [Gastrolobium bilobum]